MELTLKTKNYLFQKLYLKREEIVLIEKAINEDENIIELLNQVKSISSKPDVIKSVCSCPEHRGSSDPNKYCNVCGHARY